jgi:hypothetical protein
MRKDAKSEEFWRHYLTKGHSVEHALRAVFKFIPHDPRCMLWPRRSPAQEGR